MANKKDGYSPSDPETLKNDPVFRHVPKVEREGNPDAKVLAKAYTEFAKDGLSKQERETIEKIDDLVKGADIVLSKDGNSAIIAQEDGKSFNIQIQHSKSPATKSR